MTARTRTSCAATLVLAAISAAPAVADSGFYIGASAGGATLESDPQDIGVPGLPLSLDEDDSAFKLFGGYEFDLPVIDVGVEVAYHDFGEPDIQATFGEILLDNTGVSAFGIAAVDVGPIDVFGKLGLLAWEVDAEIFGTGASDDGTDLGYGLGLRFELGAFQVRGEYEVFQLDDADLAMLSLGLAYRF